MSWIISKFVLLEILDNGTRSSIQNDDGECTSVAMEEVSEGMIMSSKIGGGEDHCATGSSEPDEKYSDMESN